MSVIVVISRFTCTFTRATNDACASSSSKLPTISVHTPALTYREVALHLIIRAINSTTGHILSLY